MEGVGLNVYCQDGCFADIGSDPEDGKTEESVTYASILDDIVFERIGQVRWLECRFGGALAGNYPRLSAIIESL